MITLQELISRKYSRIAILQKLLEDEDRVSELDRMEKEIQALKEEINIKESAES